MPSRRIVRARKGGRCSSDFAHASTIRPGDRVMVITYFPSDEIVRGFGMPPFTRARRCTWCVERGESKGVVDV